MSLRARLVLGVIVLTALGLVIADVATYTPLRSFLLHRTDTTLEASHPKVEALAFGSRLGDGDEGGHRPGPAGAGGPGIDDYQVRTLSGGVLVSRTVRQLAEQASEAPPRLPATISLPAWKDSEGRPGRPLHGSGEVRRRPVPRLGGDRAPCAGQDPAHCELAKRRRRHTASPPVDRAARHGRCARRDRGARPLRRAARPATASVDRVRCVDGFGHNLVDNLLSNVRAHTPADRPVQIAVGRVNGSAVIEVADEGPGMSADVLDRVFERFYRPDASRSRASGGVGLGLSIVAAVAQAHGGRAEAESEAGRGATFPIVLPLTQQDQNGAGT